MENFVLITFCAMSRIRADEMCFVFPFCTIYNVLINIYFISWSKCIDKEMVCGIPSKMWRGKKILGCLSFSSSLFIRKLDGSLFDWIVRVMNDVATHKYQSHKMYTQKIMFRWKNFERKNIVWKMQTKKVCMKIE